ncbi:MAG TPA: site-2 protease family protein [Polyangiaceae bacterium]|jgi:Zn-dependent protease|nr:site-2 protease family protein [Polyangiaceae bacterium]
MNSPISPEPLSTDVQAEPLAGEARPGPPRRPASKSVLLAGLMALLAKAKGLLFLVKGLQFGKVLLTMGSMFVMIWVEARYYGWWYGVGFVLLIFIHEMGHAFAIRRAGLAAGLPVFIPFVGAFISLRDQPRSPREEATIALAGPVAGAAASALCALVYLLTTQRLFLALAYGGFFLNLFNMIPISPLDGGRAASVFSRKAWWIGVAVLGTVFWLTRAPQIMLIGVFALMHGMRRAGPQVETTPDVRRDVAASYFGLCGFLALGIFLTSRALSG